MQPIANRIAKKQAGYSLVELSVALAIVAVILVGGLMGTRQILLTNNVNNQLKDSAQVIAKITRQFQNALTTSGATNENLVPLSYWPKERFTNTSTASGTSTIVKTEVRGVIAGTKEHIFSNSAEIGKLGVNSGFVYYFEDVPSAACADLVSGLDNMAYAIYAGSASGVTPSGAKPGSNEVKKPDDATISPTELGKGCSSVNPLVDIAAIIRL